MLPQSIRLPKKEFDNKNYKTVKTPFFLLKTKKNSLEYSRIGVVIGKSVYKEANKRNFWKRQAKSALVKKGPQGNDLLLIFLSAKTPLTKKVFQTILLESFNNIK